MTSRLLDDQSSGHTTTGPKPKSKGDVQDDGYFATYNHYDIHKEMLQVREMNESLICINLMVIEGYYSYGKLSPSD